MKTLPFRLLLDWEHCADGVEWKPTSMRPVGQVPGLLGAVVGSGQLGPTPMEEVDSPVFVELSEQRQLRRFELRHLDQARVLAFVNATQPTPLASFLGKVGFPEGKHLYSSQIRSEPASIIVSQQQYFRELVFAAADDDSFEAAENVNQFLFDFNTSREVVPPSVRRARRMAEILEENGVPKIGAASEFFAMPLQLTPELEVPEGGGLPRFFFRADTLAHYMVMECALIAAAGAGASACEVCGGAYLYGPLTARRTKGRFCSDACRQREFQRAKKAGRGD